MLSSQQLQMMFAQQAQAHGQAQSYAQSLAPDAYSAQGYGQVGGDMMGMGRTAVGAAVFGASFLGMVSPSLDALDPFSGSLAVGRRAMMGGMSGEYAHLARGKGFMHAFGQMRAGGMPIAPIIGRGIGGVAMAGSAYLGVGMAAGWAMDQMQMGGQQTMAVGGMMNMGMQGGMMPQMAAPGLHGSMQITNMMRDSVTSFNSDMVGQRGLMMGGTNQMSMGQATGLMGQGMQGGFFRDVQNVKQFQGRFKELLQSVKSVSDALNSTREEALQFMTQQKQMGFTSLGAATRGSMLTGAYAAGGGMAPGQMAGIGMAGVSIFRQSGGSGAEGAMTAQAAGSTLGAALGSGALSEATLLDLTGASGPQGIAALTQRWTGYAQGMMRGRHGTRLLEALVDPETGQLNAGLAAQYRAGHLTSKEVGRLSREHRGTKGFGDLIRARRGSLTSSLVSSVGAVELMGQMSENYLQDTDPLGGSYSQEMIMQRFTGMGEKESNTIRELSSKLPSLRGEVVQKWSKAFDQGMSQKYGQGNISFASFKRALMAKYVDPHAAKLQQFGAEMQTSLSAWAADALQEQMGVSQSFVGGGIDRGMTAAYSGSTDMADAMFGFGDTGGGGGVSFRTGGQFSSPSAAGTGFLPRIPHEDMPVQGLGRMLRGGSPSSVSIGAGRLTRWTGGGRGLGGFVGELGRGAGGWGKGAGESAAALREFGSAGSRFNPARGLARAASSGFGLTGAGLRIGGAAMRVGGAALRGIGGLGQLYAGYDIASGQMAERYGNNTSSWFVGGAGSLSVENGQKWGAFAKAGLLGSLRTGVAGQGFADPSSVRSLSGQLMEMGHTLGGMLAVGTDQFLGGLPSAFGADPTALLGRAPGLAAGGTAGWTGIPGATDAVGRGQHANWFTDILEGIGGTRGSSTYGGVTMAETAKMEDTLTALQESIIMPTTTLAGALGVDANSSTIENIKRSARSLGGKQAYYSGELAYGAAGGVEALSDFVAARNPAYKAVAGSKELRDTPQGRRAYLSVAGTSGLSGFGQSELQDVLKSVGRSTRMSEKELRAGYRESAKNLAYRQNPAFQIMGRWGVSGTNEVIGAEGVGDVLYETLHSGNNPKLGDALAYALSLRSQDKPLDSKARQKIVDAMSTLPGEDGTRLGHQLMTILDTKQGTAWIDNLYQTAAPDQGQQMVDAGKRYKRMSDTTRAFMESNGSVSSIIELAGGRGALSEFNAYLDDFQRGPQAATAAGGHLANFVDTIAGRDLTEEQIGLLMSAGRAMPGGHPLVTAARQQSYKQTLSKALQGGMGARRAGMMLASELRGTASMSRFHEKYGRSLRTLGINESADVSMMLSGAFRERLGDTEISGMDRAVALTTHVLTGNKISDDQSGWLSTWYAKNQPDIAPQVQGAGYEGAPVLKEFTTDMGVLVEQLKGVLHNGNAPPGGGGGAGGGGGDPAKTYTRNRSGRFGIPSEAPPP